VIRPLLRLARDFAIYTLLTIADLTRKANP
jgi:hypothetical protein